MLKTNSIFKCSALALAFVVAASAVAEAQPGGGGRGFGGRGFGGPGFGGPGGPGGADKISLLSNPQVQTELKIASEQKLFLDDIITEHREKQREAFSGIDFRTLRDKPEAEREKIMADMQAKREKLNKDAEAGLQEFLSEEQITRLDQIVLQQRGLRALTDDEVGKKLAITADQKKKIEDAFEAGNEARRKMFEDMRASRENNNQDAGNNNGGDQQGGRRGGRGAFDPAAFAEVQKKMEEAGKKTEADVLAVLSADQKKNYDDLKGKPFELERRGFGGPGGPGAFGGRPGGGRPQGDGGGRPQGDGGGRPQGDGGGRPQRPASE